MRAKKLFLQRFYEDQARRTILATALNKATKLDKKRRIKKYSEELVKLESEMNEYILRSHKIVNRIKFAKEAPKYRIDEKRMKELTSEILEMPMTVEELLEWEKGKTWN